MTTLFGTLAIIGSAIAIGDAPPTPSSLIGSPSDG